jgi:pantothenate synthetase
MPLREAYLDVVDAETFAPVGALATDAGTRSLLAIGSVWLGQTRLIDNLPLSIAPQLAAAGPAQRT